MSHKSTMCHKIYINLIRLFLSNIISFALLNIRSNQIFGLEHNYSPYLVQAE